MLSLILFAVIGINAIILAFIAFSYLKQSPLRKRLKPTYNYEELKYLIPRLDFNELEILRLIIRDEIKRYSPVQLRSIVRLVKIHVKNLVRAGRVEVKSYLSLSSRYNAIIRGVSIISLTFAL